MGKTEKSEAKKLAVMKLAAFMRSDKVFLNAEREAKKQGKIEQSAKAIRMRKALVMAGRAHPMIVAIISATKSGRDEKVTTFFVRCYQAAGLDPGTNADRPYDTRVSNAYSWYRAHTSGTGQCERPGSITAFRDWAHEQATERAARRATEIADSPESEESASAGKSAPAQSLKGFTVAQARLIGQLETVAANAKPSSAASKAITEALHDALAVAKRATAPRKRTAKPRKANGAVVGSGTVRAPLANDAQVATM